MIYAALGYPPRCRERSHSAVGGLHDERLIKQADTLLMVYPWGIIDDPEEARDLLNYYANVMTLI